MCRLLSLRFLEMSSKTSKPAIKFYFHEVNFVLPARREIKDLIRLLFKREGRKLLSLNYIFCTDEYLLAINRSYLNHDTYTDIITFELSSDPDVTEGEIYISVDRVRENARNFSEPFIKELRRVIIHGALHLCGHTDHSEKEKRKMRTLEDKYLAL